MSLPLPLVSIVVATYNAGVVLEGCLDSVRSQAPGVAELVVIDGGSTDATVEIIRTNAASDGFPRELRVRPSYRPWRPAPPGQ